VHSSDTGLETITVHMNESRVSSSSYHRDLVKVLRDMSQMCPKFTHVEFARFGTNYPLAPEPLFPTMADFFVKHAALISVTFHGFYDIPGSFLLELASVPSLRTVSFRDRCSFSHETVSYEYHAERNNVQTLHVSKFISVCALFPNITVLEMTDFNVKNLPLLAKYCPLVSIAVLIMSKPSEIFSEKTLRAVCRWRGISKLAMEGSGIAETLLTDLVATCTTLTELTTTNYHGFVCLNKCFPKTYVGSKMLSLKTHCNRADTLIRILSLCPHLHTLSLHRNKSDNIVSQTPMRHALNHITADCSVRNLKLFEFADLGDEDIQQLQHARLETLTIRESDKLTSSGVLTLLSTLHSLRKIALIDCHQIEHYVILKTPQLCPTLRSLTYCKWVRCTCGDYHCGCGYSQDQERNEIMSQTLRLVFPQLTDVDVDI